MNSQIYDTIHSELIHGDISIIPVARGVEKRDKSCALGTTVGKGNNHWNVFENNKMKSKYNIEILRLCT